jgi:hypothetical protein
MEDFLRLELEKEEPSEKLKQLLLDSKTLVQLSRNKMSRFYDQWDRNDQIYRGIRPTDAEDLKARERKEPEKMVVPITYSQVQTFVAFGYSLFTQREKIFELEGYTSADTKPAKVGEALLERDLRYNLFEAVLGQFLLDVARFGVGVGKVCWVEERQFVKETIPGEPIQWQGQTIGMQPDREVMVETIKYQGNKLTNISPYRFFPDVRLPLTRFQEGEFCASEEVYSFATLKQWQREGRIAGVDHIKNLSKEDTTTRARRDNELDLTLDSPTASRQGDGQLKQAVIVTEVQRRIVPSDYIIDGKPLGPEDYPVMYVIWYANDNRVIKCEPMNYVHDQFTYFCAPFLNDNNSLVPPALADVIDSLQDVITWFINSRITSVRKIISNYLVVDPSGINMDDLNNRRPVIRLKPSAAGGIDRYIKQLNLSDVTANHVGDVKFLHEMIQIVTGINDTILGQFQPGRRSATEARNTTSGAASRLKATFSTIFRAALEPMARQMLSNLQDGLDEETFIRMVDIVDEEDMDKATFLPVTKADLAGNYSFQVFDGTLPSERYHNAQTLMDLVTSLMSNPEAAAVFQLNPLALLFEALELRGIRNPKRFKLPNVQQQQLLAQLAAQNAPAPASGPGGTTPRVPGPTGQPVLPFPAGLAGSGGSAGY